MRRWQRIAITYVKREAAWYDTLTWLMYAGLERCSWSNDEDTYSGTGDTAVLLLQYTLLLTSNETSALVLSLTSKLAGDAKVDGIRIFTPRLVSHGFSAQVGVRLIYFPVMNGRVPAPDPTPKLLQASSLFTSSGTVPKWKYKCEHNYRLLTAPDRPLDHSGNWVYALHIANNSNT